MKANPIMELAWIRGSLVVMGRNQTMKMLIEDTLPSARRKKLFGFRVKAHPAVAQNTHHSTR